VLVKGAKFGQNDGLEDSECIKLKARGALLNSQIDITAEQNLPD
jgi:hypothetical protein